MIDYIRKNSPHTRNMLRIKKEVNAYIDEYLYTHSDNPTQQHLLEVFGKKQMDIYNTIPSINQNISSSQLNTQDNPVLVTNINEVSDKDSTFDDIENKLAVDKWLNDDKYTESEKIIILLKVCYFTDLEIASFMNFCASRVSQVIGGIRIKNAKF